MTRTTAAQLDELIEAATVDCYNASEEVCGLFTHLEEDLALPFTTAVLGVTTTVIAIDLTNDDRIVAVCTRGGSRQVIAVLELPMPDPPPSGAKWIQAYSRWFAQQGGA